MATYETRKESNGCAKVLIFALLILFAPFLLEFLGFILFVLISFIGHLLGAW